MNLDPGVRDAPQPTPRMRIPGSGLGALCTAQAVRLDARARTLIVQQLLRSMP